MFSLHIYKETNLSETMQFNEISRWTSLSTEFLISSLSCFLYAKEIKEWKC